MSDSWKERAKAQQQDFAIAFGDRTWDRFHRTDHAKELREKISFAFVGPPNSTGYTEEQKKLVSEIIDKCVECCNKDEYATIAFLFICAYNKTSPDATVPLIRVIKNDGKRPKLSYFIDHVGRVYEDWSDFLKNNIFDGWWICIPKDAEYAFSSQNEVRVEFHDQSERGKVLREIDRVSSIASAVTATSMIVGLGLSFFPPTALLGAVTMTASSIVGTPGALYSTGRSVGRLVDRGSHKQSINPFLSGEARACWLTTTASVFSTGAMVSGQILASTAKAGYLAGSGTRFFCTALNVSSLSVNGLGVINSIYEVAKKDEVTTLDVLQLSTSILFFTHSAVNFQTASTIIKEAQHTAIQEMRGKISRKSRDAFDTMHQARKEMIEPGKVRTMHGNKEFIRDLKKINNPKEFFDHFKVVQGNQLSVDNELVINPKAFLQMKDPERLTVMKNCRDLRNSNISDKQFNRNVSSVKSRYRIEFERKREIASKNIERAFEGSHVKDHILSNLKPREIDRMDQVLSQSGKNYNPKCLEVAKKMAEQMECKTVGEFTAATEFVIRRLDKQVSELRKNNPNPVKPAGMRDKDFFFGQAADDFLNNQHNTQNNTVHEFKTLMRTCNEKNSLGDLRFSDAMSAANHYDKHCTFPKIHQDKNLSPGEYFDLARGMCSGHVEDPIWVQDGSALMSKFECEECDAVAVRYDKMADGKSVIATLMPSEKKNCSPTNGNQPSSK